MAGEGGGGHYLNKLGSGSLGDATYPISRLYALWFQTRLFFHFFSVNVYVKHVNPKAVPFWTQGHNLNKLGRSLLDAATLGLGILGQVWCLTAPIPDLCPLSYLWFQRRIVLQFSFRKSILACVT